MTQAAAEAPTLIATQDEFDRTVQAFANERLVAVDTEAASFHRYVDRVYLVQLSTRSATVVVDPLAVADLSAFGRLLKDPKVETVFHDADYDLRLLSKAYGFQARNLFDTRIAAQFLNEPGIGLAALLEKYLNIKLDKRFQRADWSARPLPAAMLEYAAMDTRFLPELRDILRERLEERGRLAWAEEEFELLTHVQWSQAEDAEPGYLRIKGAKALKGRQLAILRELYEWREKTAKRLDRAAFRVLNNEVMLAIAQSPPANADALAQMSGVSTELAARRGREVLGAIKRAMALPEKDLPRVPRPPKRVTDSEFEARVERLKAVRNAAAKRLELAPGVVCPNGTLEAIARAAPKTLEELRALPGVRQWQVEEIGKDLLQAVGGAAST